MLTYLVSVTEDLISTALLCALALGYARLAWPKGGMRSIAVGIVIALVASAVMAVMKQTTNMVDTGLWNMRIFMTAAVALVVVLVCFIRPIFRSKIGSYVMQVALSLFVFCRVFYKVPDVYLYPVNFNLNDNNIVSSDFALRLIGYLCGLIVVVLAAVALYKATRSLGRRWLGIGLAAVSVIIGLLQLMTCLQTMLARHIIKNNPIMFELVKFFSNSSTAFAFVVMGIALILVVLVIIASVRDDEPYANPAEHRKIRAKWRNRRRWSVCLIVCLIVSASALTVLKDLDNREPELSPSEECEVRDGAVFVSLDQVSDGHLHRFTYETDSGAGVRFIVIKKPGASSYGVGLDACEICGETGYYERDGQVVCKLCDVVMNINTIGFKGGCNPIPFEYKVEDGYIVVETDELAQYEKTFKS